MMKEISEESLDEYEEELTRNAFPFTYELEMDGIASMLLELNLNMRRLILALREIKKK